MGRGARIVGGVALAAALTLGSVGLASAVEVNPQFASQRMVEVNPQ